MNEKMAPFAMAMSTCNNEEFLSDEGVDLRKDPMALQRLKEAAEKAKI